MGAFTLRNSSDEGLCPGLPHKEQILNTASISPRESGMIIGFETVPEAEVRKWLGVIDGASPAEARDFDVLWEEARGGSVRMDYVPIDDTDSVEVQFVEAAKKMRQTRSGSVEIEFELVEAK